MLLIKYTMHDGKVRHRVTVETLLELGESQADIDAALLIAYKADQRAAINTARDAKINAGVEFPADSGFVYDSDETSQKNINGAVTMFTVATSMGTGDQFVQSWIRQDNTVAELDGPAVVGLGVMIGQHVGFHRIQANEYKGQLEAAATTDEVDAVLAAYEAL